jgi:hypothetical protein
MDDEYAWKDGHVGDGVSTDTEKALGGYEGSILYFYC